MRSMSQPNPRPSSLSKRSSRHRATLQPFSLCSRCGGARRDDEWQRKSFSPGLARDMSLQDTEDVAQEPEGQELVGCALVLEEDVEEGRLVRDLRGEEQIGLGASEGFVDKAAGAEGEGREVRERNELSGEYGAQFGGGVLDLREGVFEERVVVLLRVRHSRRSVPRVGVAAAAWSCRKHRHDRRRALSISVPPPSGARPASRERARGVPRTHR